MQPSAWFLIGILGAALALIGFVGPAALAAYGLGILVGSLSVILILADRPGTKLPVVVLAVALAAGASPATAQPTFDTNYLNAKLACVGSGCPACRAIDPEAFVLCDRVEGEQISFSSTAGSITAAGSISASRIIATGSAPTLSTCGTSPTITGTDSGGTVTTGTGATACTVTFSAAFPNGAACVASPTHTSVGHVIISASSSTAFTFVGSSSTDTKTIHYVCVGR